MITVKQITNALPDWVNNEYSSICPFNANNTRIALIKRDHVGLWDGQGVFLRDLPMPASSEFRWSRKNPRLAYWIVQNQLMKWEEPQNGKSIGGSVPVRKFSEYLPVTPDGRNGITGAGESDISEDDDHLVLSNGDRTEVFVYQISADRKKGVFRVDPFDGLKITPDNNVLISSEKGIWLYRSNEAPRQVAPKNGHAAVARDANGEEVLIWSNAASNPVDPAGCDNGIVKIRLSDGKKTCLLSHIPWSMAVNIGTCDQPFALVSTYGTPTGVPMENKLLKVPFDVSMKIETIGEHGSLPTGVKNHDYTWQPKAALSRDGSRFAFCSNRGFNKVLDYSEVFLGEMAAPADPTPAPGTGVGGYWKLVDFSGQDGKRWKWEFEVINGQMTVKVYDWIPN